MIIIFYQYARKQPRKKRTVTKNPSVKFSSIKIPNKSSVLFKAYVMSKSFYNTDLYNIIHTCLLKGSEWSVSCGKFVMKQFKDFVVGVA